MITPSTIERSNLDQARLDPVTLTMWWNKLITIVDEAQATLLRTAFSRIVTAG